MRVRQTARRLEVPWQALVLAVHAWILSRLSGEDVVTTGCGPAGGPEGLVVGRRLAVPDGDWSSLVRAASAVLAAGSPPQSTGAAEPEPGRYDTILDLSDGGTDGPGTARALRTAVRWRGDRIRLALGYRTDTIDHDYAARLAGYYRTALAALVAAPESAPAAHCLVSEREWRHQRTQLCGPRRPLPDRRLHELFEERVGRHPEVVALVHRGQRWTYGELNQRANRLARRLLRAGLANEDTVAVVTERNLTWAAAVLAVLKAGGAYLPIEPGFPPQRIARTLDRAGCRYVITEAGSGVNLEAALTAPTTVLPADPGPDADGGENLDLPVAADQLAYVYFTSGSTGEPKGVMCEQAGMLNHVLAKIDDLEITAGSVVAQVAPQSFDISLWQLVAALLVGGRTVIIEQPAVVDTARFLDVLSDEAVEVLQVVPSYLEALVFHVQRHPRELPALRFVSTTGEALKKELVVRWFASYPAIRLVNAYGLTETCDDTNHEVMDQPPAGVHVPLGRALPNTDIYLVDEHLAPVPLGAPGEIVFSGVCVARGYINDPERTAAVFSRDPYWPDRRRYRSGDFGRWLPDGRLEFLGRRDRQVKIRGFRVEIGEVEDALLRVPGVRDAVVVVSEDPQPCLHAFYCGDPGLGGDELRAELGRTLAPYLLPGTYRRLEALPLAGTGKIDRNALAAIAASAPPDVHSAPRTTTEQWLVRLWAEILQLPADRVGRHHNFFEIGTSLTAIKLLARLDRRVSLQELAAHPILADLGLLIDGRVAAARAGPAVVRLRVAPAAGEPSRVQAGGPFRAAVPGSHSYDVLDLTIEAARPPVVRVPRREAGDDPRAWAAERRPELSALVADHGAALVRGLDLRNPGGLGGVASVLSGSPMDEREGFASREHYGKGLYSGAEWPPDQPMCMHHEMSYARTVPSLLMVACLRTAVEGGGTGLADSCEVLAALPSELVDRFGQEGWLLRRVFHGFVGVDWQEAFGVADLESVNTYCAANDIDAVWDSDGTLRTAQRRGAVVRHPVTGQRCWFNQIAFLNAWTLAPEIREYLEAVLGPDRLPFNSFHGDGEPIDARTVQLINDVYEEATVCEPWQNGDVLLIDNIRMAHSRAPYAGSREVVVAFGDPLAVADLADTAPDGGPR